MSYVDDSTLLDISFCDFGFIPIGADSSRNRLFGFGWARYPVFFAPDGDKPPHRILVASGRSVDLNVLPGKPRVAPLPDPVGTFFLANVFEPRIHGGPHRIRP